jgi:prepilin-type N-terminal cleavage/methylation domain-containing protein
MQNLAKRVKKENQNTLEAKSCTLAGGFALIEMIIASAILAIVLLGVMQVGTTLSQISSGAKFTGDLTNLTTSLQSIINNAATCTTMLAGVPSNSPFNATAAQQTSTSPTGGMDIALQIPGASAVVIQGGRSYPQFGISVLELKMYAAVPAGLGAAGSQLWSEVLQLKASKLNLKLLGGSSLAARDLGRFVVKVDAAGNVVECGSAVSNAQDACLAAGGTYNSATNTCKQCATFTGGAFGSANCFCPSNLSIAPTRSGTCNPGDFAGPLTGALASPPGWRQDCSTAAGTIAYASCSITCCNI